MGVIQSNRMEKLFQQYIDLVLPAQVNFNKTLSRIFRQIKYIEKSYGRDRSGPVFLSNYNMQSIRLVFLNWLQKTLPKVLKLTIRGVKPTTSEEFAL